MVAKRRFVDAETLDYTLANGAPSADETHVPTVIRLLSLRYGSCPVAPTLGNKVYGELKKLGDDAPRKTEQFARAALKPLTDSRAISELQVVGVVGTLGRLGLDVSFIDQNGEERSLNFPISRGA